MRRERRSPRLREFALGIALAGGVACGRAADSGVNQPTVEFHFIDPASRSGSTRHRIRGDSGTLAIRPEVLLTTDDITTATARTRRFWLILSPRTQEVNEVELTLTPDGATRLGRATAAAVGQQLAMLIDGEVASRILIMEPLGSQRLVLAGRFTRAEVRGLARRLSGRSP